jgi:8-oxo-dGTP pyrophosphatase MutT (NUDIX family)
LTGAAAARAGAADHGLAAGIDAQRVRLLARAMEAPPADWLPVVIGGHEVGIVHPDVAAFLASDAFGFVLLDYQLVLDDDGLGPAGRSALLATAARGLQQAGMLRGWRDEVLDVRPQPDAAPLATLERAACRTLGITTRAVHLNAFTPDGALMVAQRAAHKQIDPGLWDNLVGGMVPAGESEREALAREAREEAGLDLAPLAVTRGGRVPVTRRVPEGWQAEIVQVFDTVLPAGVALANQDGEVAAIEARSVGAVLDGIARDQFTLESALVLLDALARRGGR